MSSNPLSIIELMEKEYDVTIKGDDSAGKRCFNGLFEIEDDNKVNIEKIKSMKHLYELGDSKNRTGCLKLTQFFIKDFFSEFFEGKKPS